MSESDRIDELEITVAHQSRQIEDLSDTLTEQWKIIEGLRRQLARLTDRFQAMETQAEAPPDTAKPPHW
jgi:SlyX protein